MKIRTKYEIGQEVWFKTHYSHFASAKITSIAVYGDNEWIYCFENYVPRAESELYPSKEELLKSL